MKNIISFILTIGFIMPTTSPLIILTMGDAEIDSATSTSVHARTDIDDLVTGEAERGLNYATYEPDKWLLDGSFHFAPDPAHIGFVSSSISNASGEFTSAVQVALTLDAVVDIEQGVAFEFSGMSNDYCKEIVVAYYDATYTLIGSDYTYMGIDTYNYFAEVPSVIEDVKYIRISFVETSETYRHVKLLEIFVDGVLWDKSDIKTANIIEEIDPVSLTSPSNELTFSVHDASGNFSIVDPQGVYAGLKENQPLDVYEDVNTDRLYMGRFYLQNWASGGDDIAEFSGTSAVNRLDGETTYGKHFHYTTYTPYTAQDVMDCIMVNYGGCGTGEASTIEYEIDSSLANIPIDGWLAIQSRRDALRQLAFAVGGYVDDTRDGKVTIKPLELVSGTSSYDFSLGNSDISNANIELTPLVTGIKIVSHLYNDVTYSGSDKVYFSGAVGVGDYLYLMSGERIYTVVPDFLNSTASIDSGSLIVSANYMQVTVTRAGNLVINRSQETIDNTVEHYFDIPTPAGTPENILIIDNATLVNPDNVDDIGLRLMEYYTQRYNLQAKLFASEIAVGDSAKIDTQSSKELGGFVERLEIDLAGGFVQKMKTVGAILPHASLWYTIDCMLLGGGGAGGSNLGGGGGAGELLDTFSILAIGETYDVVVGAGGTGSAGNSGTNGETSTFTTRGAAGGGGGGAGSTSTGTDGSKGFSGGNGGGGGGCNTGTDAEGAGGVGSQYDGGAGSNGATNYGGGGGGGNSEGGYSGYSGGGADTGDGGDGVANSITGSSVVYGGGGGGVGVVYAGGGGSGGGGNSNISGAGTAGTGGLGGGGGASNNSNSGASGGSGLVVLRVLTTDYSGTTTGTPNISIDGLYTVIKYTADGSYTA